MMAAVPVAVMGSSNLNNNSRETDIRTLREPPDDLEPLPTWLNVILVIWLLVVVAVFIYAVISVVGF